VFFCVSSRNDPALPILEQLLRDYPGFDAHILVEDEDPNLSHSDGRAENLGPNPKIRNMSRAYKEAKGDIVWIVDCNVWVGPDVAGGMVDLLCGFSPNGPKRKYKFIHQLPLVIDISTCRAPESAGSFVSSLASCRSTEPPTLPLIESGGLLEEMFLSTSHAKFYTAINTVAIAPCIVGKSNMFRRSHLNALTTTADRSRQPGIDHFSSNICEDHLIGDLLWKSPVPEEIYRRASKEGTEIDTSAEPTLCSADQMWGNHGLLPPSPVNLAIQPTSHYPLNSYVDRRTRWLRVRKFTVTTATFIEPGTESFLCSAYGAFAFTSLPWCSQALGIPQTWTAFFISWFISVFCWMIVDRWVFFMLQSTSPGPGQAPPFASQGQNSKPWSQWLLAWLGREVLAFPIWAWAVAGGVTVMWRGRRFWVGVDMRVHEILNDQTSRRSQKAHDQKGKDE